MEPNMLMFIFLIQLAFQQMEV